MTGHLASVCAALPLLRTIYGMERQLLPLFVIFFYIYFIKFMHMCATVYGGQRTVYRKSVLTHHMVIRLGLKHLYPLSHLVDL